MLSAVQKHSYNFIMMSAIY